MLMNFAKALFMAFLLIIAFNWSQNGRYQLVEFKAAADQNKHAILDSREGVVYIYTHQTGKNERRKWSEIRPFQDTREAFVNAVQ